MPVLYGEWRPIGQCGKSVSDYLRPADVRMTYLSWDESRASRVNIVMSCILPGLIRVTARETHRPHGHGDHSNELFSLFSHLP